MGIGDLSTLGTLLAAGYKHELIGPLTIRRLRLILFVCEVMVRLRRHPSGFYISLGLLSRATALHAAALTGNIGAVNLLLQHSANPASTNHAHGATPLHLAAYDGHEAVAQRLLEVGASTSVRDKRGRTAAAWANRRGHVELGNRLASLRTSTVLTHAWTHAPSGFC